MEKETLQVRLVDSIEKFRAEEDKWNRAVRKQHHDNLFLSFEWMFTWWKYFGKGRDLFLLFIEDKGGLTIGIAPLMCSKEYKKGFPVRKIQFIASDISDNLDFIFCSDKKKEVLTAAVRYLLRRDRWHLLFLEQLSYESETVKLLISIARELNLPYSCVETYPSPYIDKKDLTWNGYLAGRSKAIRKKFKICFDEVANNMGEVVEFISDPEKVIETIDVIAEIDKRSQKAARGAILFSSPEITAFHKELATVLFRKGYAVYIALLKKKDRAIAYEYSFYFKNRILDFAGSFDIFFLEFSPGHITFAESIKKFFNQANVSYIDLGRGDQPFKMRYATGKRRYQNVVISNSGVVGRGLFILGYSIKPAIFYCKKRLSCSISKKGARNFLFQVAYHTGNFFFQNRSVPVLFYHSIDNSNSEISVPVAEFKEQMTFLKEKGYSTISLVDYASALKSNTPLPKKSFVLTFDDGFANNFSSAYPILKEYGFSATIFLITGIIGKKYTVIDNQDIPKFKILGWRHLNEMVNNGISFGAHTKTHPDLTTLNPREIKEEIVESKKNIEENLNIPIKTFSYPFGRYNDEVVTAVKECGFEAACAVTKGVKNAGDSLFTLKRVVIGPDTPLSYFKFIFSGFYDLNIKRKQVWNKIRQ